MRQTSESRVWVWWLVLALMLCTRLVPDSGIAAEAVSATGPRGATPLEKTGLPPEIVARVPREGGPEGYTGSAACRS